MSAMDIGTVYVTIKYVRSARISGGGWAQSVCRLVRAVEQRGSGEGGGGPGADATSNLSNAKGVELEFTNTGLILDLATGFTSAKTVTEW